MGCWHPSEFVRHVHRQKCAKSIYLQYFGVQNNLDMSETAGSILATSDVLQNIHELSSDQFNMGNETQIDALQIGLKIGDNFLFAGNSTNIGMEFTLDNDLVSFIKNGMANENGELDLNYSGNFDALGMRFQMINSTYFGLQRIFLDEKLRVGVTYHMNNYVAGAKLVANTFSLTSTENTATGMNSLDLDYDFNLATTQKSIQSDEIIVAFYVKHFLKKPSPHHKKSPKVLRKDLTFEHYLHSKTYFYDFRETLILNNPPCFYVDFTSPGIKTWMQKRPEIQTKKKMPKVGRKSRPRSAV